MDRRSFLKRASVVAGAAAIPFTALNARTASAQAVRRGQTGGYGPLFPVEDQTTGLPLHHTARRLQVPDVSDGQVIR